MSGAPTASDQLADLATRYRIETEFVSIDGARRRPGPDTVLALLRALGAPITRPEEARAMSHQLRREAREQVLEPVLVHRIGRSERAAGSAPALVTLPEDLNAEQAWLTLQLEGGEARHERLAPMVRSSRALAGGYRHHRVDLGRLAGGPLPAGYHHLTLEAPGLPAPVTPALVISAPACPTPVRGWGIFMPLHAVRTEHDWGTGSYRDLASLGAWVAGLGGAMVGCLPLYPSFLDPPADPSPYRPVSRLAYNDLYIDPTTLAELDVAPEARRLLNDGAFLARIKAARTAEVVEYEEVAQLRRQVLEPLARALFSGPSPRRDQLDEFARAHPELIDYARFMADRQAGGGTGETGRAGGEDAGYHLYGQWAAAEQLAQAASVLPLYADFPIGVHPDGFDAARYPDSFVRGVDGGAPPDAFFRAGQDWGFRPLHPERIRHDHYRYVIAALRRAFRHAGCLRVDHIMGLQRLYMIPEGADARHGAYVAYQADELHALVSLEAHRAGAVVVGEDLGTVPDGVHRRMAADGMLRSWVFQFESSAAEPLPEPPAAALASMGTHDLPRFATYFGGGDIEEDARAGRMTTVEADHRQADRACWRHSLLRALDLPEGDGDGGGDRGDSGGRDEEAGLALQGCLEHLATSAAQLVLVDLEELWGETEPQNRPGTGTEAGNWRRRGARTLNEARADAALNDVLAGIGRLREAPTT